MPTTDAQSLALGKLLLIQHVLEVLPNETSIASFLCRSLSTIPGVKDVHICIRGVHTPDDATYRELCRACGKNGSSLATPPPTKLFPLRTSHQVYGALFLSIDNEDQLSFCQPYLANTANTVATLLENRDHVHQLHVANERIQRGREELEVRVQQRTADLLHANEELQREMCERKANEAKLHRITNLYAALSQCNEAIVRCTFEAELFQQICRIAVVSGDMKLAWIGLIDEAGQLVKPVASYGDSVEYLEGIHIPLDVNDPSGRGPTATAIRENQPFWCQDFLHDPVAAPWHERSQRYGWGAMASLPLQQNGAVIGTFTLYAYEVNAFDEAARKLLVEMTSNISYALSNFYNEAERQQAAQAERANRAKDTFLAIMSHDIRTPLGGMLGMLEMLSMTHLDAKQIATLNTARSSGQDLLRILNDILDWSKIEEGKLEITPTPTVIGAMLQEVVNIHSNAALTKSLTVLKRIDSSLATSYWADQLRLSQVLHNFVSNAIKFTEFGEIEIRAELLESLAGGDLIRISVKDTGIGISKKEQENLFQNYSQGNADTARMYGGTGLGLAICSRLAKMQGGEIALISEPGQGSTFSITLTLPRSNSMMEMSVPRQRDVEQHAIQPLFINDTHAPLVLVVDDHPTNRELLARQLTLLGLRVTAAENGEVALTLWRDVCFAMVITDCHMPDMDGYEMTRAIRNIEAIAGRPRTPVIAWTANALKEEKERINAAGMDELLVKPVSINVLRVVLARWLKPSVNGGKDAEVELSSPGFDSSQETTSPIDYSVLDAIISNRDEQRQLLRDFLSHIRNDRNNLSELLAQDNRAATQSTAHRMKGSCRMVGAMRLGNTCASIEQAAETGDIITLRVAVADLDEMLQEVQKFVG
jgi:signal transduction histidine kinase/DNA-binding response OmpR family regulator